MSKTYIFYISGMTCTSCSNSIISYITNELATTPTKLENFHTDLTAINDPKKTIIILADDEQEEQDEEREKQKHKDIWTILKNYIEDVGYTCQDYDYSPEEPIPIPEAPSSTLKKIITKGKKFITSHWFLGALGCLAGIAVLITCLTAGALPLAAMIPLVSLSVLLTLILGANSYYQAWSKLTKSHTLTMDSLFALSTAVIVIVSIASLFVPWLPMMFEAGLLIYGFRHIGIALENTIKEKIGSAKFQDRAPKTVRLQTQGGLVDTPLAQIQPDQIIMVNPGEIIPLDGVCEDESIIYNTIITGATLPRYFFPNDEVPNYKVLAGMRLAEHNTKPLKIRVTKTQKQSYLARLDAGIEQAALEKSPIELKTGKLLGYFIPTVIALAVISGIIIGLFFSPALGIVCAVSVLVCACPCTLGLITPFAVKTGMYKAAENGVQFKSAKTLQQAEQIDTVIFDLNAR